MTDISNMADVLDVRDIIARVEELRAVCDVTVAGDDAEPLDEEDAAELADLEGLLSDLAGNGGDEQWEGEWYPVTLIRDSYFKEYAQEMADNIGAVPENAQWPMTCIDWDQAARELRMDYTSVEYSGVAYWYR